MTELEFEKLPEWLPVRYKGRNYPYKISKYGKVKNLRGHILKPYMRGQRKGSYPCVKLCLYGFQKAVDVHRLTAIHFIPNPKFKPEVNHLNLDHMEPAVFNLEWCTRSENENHKYFMNAHLEFMKVASV